MGPPPSPSHPLNYNSLPPVLLLLFSFFFSNLSFCFSFSSILVVDEAEDGTMGSWLWKWVQVSHFAPWPSGLKKMCCINLSELWNPVVISIKQQGTPSKDQKVTLLWTLGQQKPVLKNPKSQKEEAWKSRSWSSELSPFCFTGVFFTIILLWACIHAEFNSSL